MAVNPFIPIDDIDPRNQYTASGSQTTFTYSFPIFDQGDLTVIETVISGGVETDFTREIGAGTNDYAVTGVNSATGGTVVFNSARTNGNRLTIYRDLLYARATDYKVSGGFSAARINLELDRMEMQIQQLRDLQRLSVSVAPSDVTVSTVLPNATARANMIAAYDGTGKPTVVTGDALSPTQRLVNLTVTGQLFLGANTVVETSYNNLTPVAQAVGGNATANASWYSAYLAFRRSNDNSGARYILQKSRNGAVNTHGIVQNADLIGTIAFVGDDGSGYVPAAYIIAKVDGTPDVNDMPGRLEFYTTPDGSATPTLALTINQTQIATFAISPLVPNVTYPESSTKAANTKFVTDAIATITSKVVKRVNTQTGAVATGTTVIPFDDTIPQNTEGDQYMSLAVTPTNAANILVIDVVMNVGSSAASTQYMTAALFQDATADALATGVHYMGTGTDAAGQIVIKHTMTAGTTSATTFKVRMGGSSAATFTFNGIAGARKFGGVLASSITITEYTP